MKHFKTTAEIKIPSDPLQQVVGQDEAVRIARICASQKRNLLFVAPPGTGKSMIAQAIAFQLPKPTEEIAVLHNPESPERPLVEVRNASQANKEKKAVIKLKSKLVAPAGVPSFVAERLGFRCRQCGSLSKASQNVCPNCGFDKTISFTEFPSIFIERPLEEKRPLRVHTTRLSENGREEVIVYERTGEKIRVLDQRTLERLDEVRRRQPRKVIVPFSRNTFVTATGASETELLGDVRHDPYGGHPGVGTPPYLRVVPGAIHEAHQGVLFIDEIGALALVQRFLLTAMQEKKFPIVGRNPQSAGASVRVEAVPCDFVLVAASNINDLVHILPPLRSRIIGNGYEVLLATTMPPTKENEEKLCQFIAQEIRKDGRIPHASFDAVQEIVVEAKRKAKEFDGEDNAFTLRLRELSGIVRLAGDFAKSAGSDLIEPEFVKEAVRKGRNIEAQLRDKYGSVWKAGASEFVGGGRRPPSEQKEIR